MSSSVNKVILLGYVGRNPEISSSQSGKKIARFSFTTTEKWKDSHTGESQNKTEWHSIVVFNEGLANFTEKYIRQGARLYLEGQLKTRDWIDDQGVKRFKTDVILPNFNGVITIVDSGSK